MSMSKEDLRNLLQKAISKPVTSVNFRALRELLEASIDRHCSTIVSKQSGSRSRGDKISQSETDQIGSDFNRVVTDDEANSESFNDSNDDGYTNISAKIEGIITKTVTIEQEFYLYNDTITTRLKETNTENVATDDEEATTDVEQIGGEQMDINTPEMRRESKELYTEENESTRNKEQSGKEKMNIITSEIIEESKEISTEENGNKMDVEQVGGEEIEINTLEFGGESEECATGDEEDTREVEQVGEDEMDIVILEIRNESKELSTEDNGVKMDVEQVGEEEMNIITVEIGSESKELKEIDETKNNEKSVQDNNSGGKIRKRLSNESTSEGEPQSKLKKEAELEIKDQLEENSDKNYEKQPEDQQTIERIEIEPSSSQIHVENSPASKLHGETQMSESKTSSPEKESRVKTVNVPNKMKSIEKLTRKPSTENVKSQKYLNAIKEIPQKPVKKENKTKIIPNLKKKPIQRPSKPPLEANARKTAKLPDVKSNQINGKFSNEKKLPEIKRKSSDLDMNKMHRLIDRKIIEFQRALNKRDSIDRAAMNLKLREAKRKQNLELIVCGNALQNSNRCKPHYIEKNHICFCVCSYTKGTDGVLYHTLCKCNE